MLATLSLVLAHLLVVNISSERQRLVLWHATANAAEVQTYTSTSKGAIQGIQAVLVQYLSHTTNCGTTLSVV
jgi:hypothetical protein